MAPPTTLLEQERARVATPQPPERTPQEPAAAGPVSTRKERLIFTAYLAMIAMIVAFLAVTALVAA